MEGSGRWVEGAGDTRIEHDTDSSAAVDNPILRDILDSDDESDDGLPDGPVKDPATENDTHADPRSGGSDDEGAMIAPSSLVDPEGDDDGGFLPPRRTNVTSIPPRRDSGGNELGARDSGAVVVPRDSSMAESFARRTFVSSMVKTRFPLNKLMSARYVGDANGAESNGTVDTSWLDDVGSGLPRTFFGVSSMVEQQKAFGLASNSVPNVFMYDTKERKFTFDMTVNHEGAEVHARSSFTLAEGAPKMWFFKLDPRPCDTWGVNWGARLCTTFVSGATPKFVYLVGRNTFDFSYSCTRIALSILDACVLNALLLVQLTQLQEAARPISEAIVGRPMLWRWLCDQILQIFMHKAPQAWPEWWQRNATGTMLSSCSYVQEAIQHCHSGASVPPMQFFDQVFFSAVGQIDELATKYDPLSEEQVAALRSRTGRGVLVLRTWGSGIVQPQDPILPLFTRTCIARHPDWMQRAALQEELGVNERNTLGDTALHVLVALLTCDKKESTYILDKSAGKSLTVWFAVARVVTDELMPRNADPLIKNKKGLRACDLIDLHKVFTRFQRTSTEQGISIAQSMRQLEVIGRIKAMCSTSPVLECLKAAHFFSHQSEVSHLVKEELQELSETFSKLAARLASTHRLPSNLTEYEALAIAQTTVGHNKWVAINVLSFNDTGEQPLQYAVDMANHTFLNSEFIPLLVEQLWSAQDVITIWTKIHAPDEGARRGIVDLFKYYTSLASISLCVPRVKFFLDSLSDIAFAVMFSVGGVMNSCDTEWTAGKVRCGAPPDFRRMNVVSYILIVGKALRELAEFRKRNFDFHGYLTDWGNILDVAIIVTLLFITVNHNIVVEYGNCSGDGGPLTCTVTMWEVTCMSLDICHFISGILLWARVLSSFCITESVGPLLLTINKMLVEMGKFFVVMFFVVMGYVCGFRMYFNSYEVDCDPILSSGNSSSMGGYGDYDDGADTDDDAIECASDFSNTLKSIVFILSSFLGQTDFSQFEAVTSSEIMDNFTSLEEQHAQWAKRIIGEVVYGFFILISNVMLLNFLIALMSSAYERIKTRSEDVYRLVRAEQMVFYDRNKLVLPPPVNVLHLTILSVALACGAHKVLSTDSEWLCGSCFERHHSLDHAFCPSCGRYQTQLTGTQRLSADIARGIYWVFSTALVTLAFPGILLYEYAWRSSLLEDLGRGSLDDTGGAEQVGGQSQVRDVATPFTRRRKRSRSSARGSTPIPTFIQVANDDEQGRVNRTKIFNAIPGKDVDWIARTAEAKNSTVVGQAVGLVGGSGAGVPQHGWVNAGGER